MILRSERVWTSQVAAAEVAREREVYMPTHKPLTFEERVLRIEEALEQKMDKTDGEDLEERLSDLESQHEEMGPKHEELGEEVEDLKARVSDAESRIDDLESEDR
jgi:chromosome segregation ATPase